VVAGAPPGRVLGRNAARDRLDSASSTLISTTPAPRRRPRRPSRACLRPGVSCAATRQSSARAHADAHGAYFVEENVKMAAGAAGRRWHLRHDRSAVLQSSRVARQIAITESRTSAARSAPPISRCIRLATSHHLDRARIGPECRSRSSDRPRRSSGASNPDRLEVPARPLRHAASTRGAPAGGLDRDIGRCQRRRVLEVEHDAHPVSRPTRARFVSRRSRRTGSANTRIGPLTVRGEAGVHVQHPPFVPREQRPMPSTRRGPRDQPAEFVKGCARSSGWTKSSSGRRRLAGAYPSKSQNAAVALHDPPALLAGRADQRLVTGRPS